MIYTYRIYTRNMNTAPDTAHANDKAIEAIYGLSQHDWVA